jgi:hypothetical protein
MILTALIVTPMIPWIVRCPDQPTIYVNPSYKEALTGQEFEIDIDIDIDYVSNLYGYQLCLSFDNTKLNASAIEYRGFLNEVTNIWDQEVNNTGGYASLAVTSLKPAPAKTGGSPPPLATIHFKAIGVGSSSLHLYKTGLADNQPPNGMAIPHTTTDGTVQVTAGVHDVAATNVIPSKTVICQNYTGNVTVTVENRGNFTETFDVTVRGNATNIQTRAITLDSGDYATMTFTWNTTGFGKGNYAIEAVADIVQNETNINDNNFTDGWIMITMVGDLTGAPGHSEWDFVPDGSVDGSDLIVAAICFGSYPGAPLPMRWNANCDITNDNSVDGSDLIIIARHFGEHA